MLAIDLSGSTRFTIRAQADIGTYGVLAILWLSFNAFSTSRWHAVPMNCASIPAEFADERGWCSALQALKAFIWIAFLLTAGISLFTLRYALAEYQRGHRHVLTGSLARYHPRAGVQFEQPYPTGRSSEFLQFPEKFSS